MSSRVPMKKRKRFDFEGYDKKDQWDDKAVAAWIKDNERMELNLDRLQEKINLIRDTARLRRETTEKVRMRYVEENKVTAIADVCPRCKNGGMLVKGSNCTRLGCNGPQYHYGHDGSHLADDYSKEQPAVRGFREACFACRLSAEIDPDDE